VPIRNRPIACVAALVALTHLSGCSGAPTDPTPRAAIAHAGSTSTDLAGALSVRAFTITGWYDGAFHFVPGVLSVAASDGGDVYVERIEFTANQGGVDRSLAGITFGSPRRVPAGGVVDLIADPFPPFYDATGGFTSPTAVLSMTVKASFRDGGGRTGSVAADAPVPTISQASSSAILAIQAFTVDGSFENGRFYYWPKLTLKETSGISRASIKAITFELLDVGPAGRVPPAVNPAIVPAGGMIQLVEDAYGYGPWFDIDSTTANASRVSMVISFVDDLGRGSALSAVAQVVR
jgi:hypothetical protein